MNQAALSPFLTMHIPAVKHKLTAKTQLKSSFSEKKTYSRPCANQICSCIALAN